MSGVLQVRRGTFATLPNPLYAGEFGWCTDTDQLYIGNGTANENLFVAGAAITTDFAIYVATSTYGGGAGDANGLAKRSSTTTATTANKLVDSAASFDSTYLDKTVYNVTDDTWAKVTAVDSATTLSLSANIMASGESYEIANAFATIPLGFAAVPGPYAANVTVRVSPGTFSADITLTGKVASGNKTLLIKGSTTGTTTVSGAVGCSQKISLHSLTFSGTTINFNYGSEITWTNCPLVNTRVNTKNGADLTWDNNDGTGTTKLYTYIGSKNVVQNTTITIGNNPENLTSINSTITRGYTSYVGSSTFGGNDAVADGLAITSGSATSTTANKLVDSAAAFTSAVLNKTLYNSTDDTWAKVTAVDSATQLSLSVDIMASGESYVIANSFATVQAAVDAIPGTVSANTTIKVANGTFAEDVVVQGKAFSGSYWVKIKGTMTDQVGIRNVTASSNAASGATLTLDGAALTASAHIGQMVKIVAAPGLDQRAIILSNTTSVLTCITPSWAYSNSSLLNGIGTGANPTTASDARILTWGTIIDSIRITGGQKNAIAEDVKLNGTNASIAGSFVVDSLSHGELYGGWIANGATGRSVWVLDGCKCDVMNTYIDTGLLTQFTASFGNMYGVWSKPRVGPSLNSFLIFRSGRITNPAGGENGMDIEGDSIWAAAFDANTAVTLSGSSGGGYDLGARNKSLSRGSTNVNNTIGTKNIDASSTET